MKKLILGVGALLFTAATAFAQLTPVTLLQPVTITTSAVLDASIATVNLGTVTFSTANDYRNDINVTDAFSVTITAIGTVSGNVTTRAYWSQLPLDASSGQSISAAGIELYGGGTLSANTVLGVGVANAVDIDSDADGLIDSEELYSMQFLGSEAAAVPAGSYTGEITIHVVDA